MNIALVPFRFGGKVTGPKRKKSSPTFILIEEWGYRDFEGNGNFHTVLVSWMFLSVQTFSFLKRLSADLFICEIFDKWTPSDKNKTKKFNLRIECARTVRLKILG